MITPDAIRCAECEAVFYPTAAFCPRCGGADVEARPLSITGVVASSTAVGDNVIAEVLLDDGVLVLARVVADELVVVGCRVRHVPADEMRFELDG